MTRTVTTTVKKEYDTEGRIVCETTTTVETETPTYSPSGQPIVPSPWNPAPNLPYVWTNDVIKCATLSAGDVGQQARNRARLGLAKSTA